MTVNLKPVVEFLKKQPDFPILDYCIVDSSYADTVVYPPIGISGHVTTDVSGVAKWISDKEKYPEHGYVIWTFNYADLFRRILESSDIPEEIKTAIKTHCPDLEPKAQASKLIDDFIIGPFFSQHKIRLVQVYVVFPPGGSNNQSYSHIIDLSVLE